MRALATLIELENRVKKMEERSSIQDETIRRMFNFIQRLIDEEAKKLEERSSIQDDAIKRISDFVRRVLDEQSDNKGVLTENRHLREEERMQTSETENTI